mmetsp:Transcript_2168/g.4749  ORF Transcript_2168/g.4749 Transcript_2168/m.4749 type:complete len:94 (-) Transcript_2168:521-802(-)
MSSLLAVDVLIHKGKIKWQNSFPKVPMMPPWIFHVVMWYIHFHQLIVEISIDMYEKICHAATQGNRKLCISSEMFFCLIDNSELLPSLWVFLH